jgi:hypothetical protein
MLEGCLPKESRYPTEKFSAPSQLTWLQSAPPEADPYIDSRVRGTDQHR